MKSSLQSVHVTPNLNELIDSDECLRALLHIQKIGNIDFEKYTLSQDAKAYLAAEAAVRNSVYAASSVSLTAVSPWTATFISCMGHLFTAPATALCELEALGLETLSKPVRLRLVTWRMHLLLLLGQFPEGLSLRSDIEEEILTCKSPWRAELLTVLALSHFSTAQSRRSVELHKLAISYIEHSPEIFMKTFGC